MMKKILLQTAFLLFTSVANAQTPTFDWAKIIGGTYGYSDGSAVTVDLTGNVYATGHFEGTIDFDPGAGVFNMTSTGVRSGFITKKDANGNLIWAKQLTGNIKIKSISVNSSGTICLGGSFEDVVDFDPGPSIYNLNCPVLSDIFILKLNSAGDLIWVRQFAGGDNDVANSVVLDASGDVYATGNFQDFLDFDPGPGYFFLNGDFDSNNNAFVIKLTNAGDFSFAKELSGGTTSAISIAICPSGNLYITGSFNGTIDFDPGPGVYNLTAVNFPYGFVLKLSGTGNFIWAKTIGETGNASPYHIQTDSFENVYLTGYFIYTTDLDPGPGVYNIISNGYWDAFILKLDASGGFVWAKALGGNTSNDTGICISLDNNGNLYCTGNFLGTVDFDPGPGTFNLTATSGDDTYVLKLNNSGTFLWAKAITATSNMYVFSTVADASGNVYTTGRFVGTCDFDPGSGTFTLYAPSGYYMFLSKLDASGNFVWSHGPGSAAIMQIGSMTTDAFGNIYTTGYFVGKVDFDPGPGTFYLSTTTTDYVGDAFVTKFDASGNLIWAKQLSGLNSVNPTSIDVDAFGNVYTSGDFVGTVDFDPGSGTFNLVSSSSNTDVFVLKQNASGDFVWATKSGISGVSESINSITLDNSSNLVAVGQSFTGTGSIQIYINKLNSTGTLIWTKTIGGLGTDKANSVDTDVSGNIYYTGYFTQSTDFDPGVGDFTMIPNSTDAFVSKLNSAGDFVWAKQITGSGVTLGNGIRLNPSGTINLSGSFSDTCDFDPGTGTYKLISVGGFNNLDFFISKLDNSGNFIWAKQFVSTGQDVFIAMTTDNAENVYSTGNYNSTTDFDPDSAAVFNLTVTDYPNMFISKLDSSGNFVSAQQFGSTIYDSNYEQSRAISIDGFNNIYTTGFFYDTIDFDPSAGVFNLTPTGFPDVFILKLNQCTTTPIATITPAGNTTFCSGGSVTLNANTGTGLTYQWKKYGNPISGATSSSYVATGSGSYKVVVTNASGCSASSTTVTVTVNPLPTATASASGSTAICPGSSVTLNANTGAGLNYQWRKYSNDISGATGATYAATGAGTYKVRVTDANGCSKTSNNIAVTVLPSPTATITATGPTTFCAGDSVKLSAASGAGNSYQWRKGSSVINGATGLNYYAKTTGNYKVTVTSSNGCTKNSNVIAVSVPCRVGENMQSDEEAIMVYPNPSDDQFTVELPDGTFNFRIYDLLGKQINNYSHTIQNGKLLISIPDKGVYILEVSNSQKTYTLKLIKI